MVNCVLLYSKNFKRIRYNNASLLCFIDVQISIIIFEIKSPKGKTTTLLRTTLLHSSTLLLSCQPTIPFININDHTSQSKTHINDRFIHTSYMSTHERAYRNDNSEIYYSHLFFDISLSALSLSLSNYIYSTFIYSILYTIYFQLIYDTTVHIYIHLHIHIHTLEQEQGRGRG